HEQETGVGVGAVDASAEDFAGEGGVVLLRVVAEQGEAEAALALERAVAGTAVAAHAAEQAHDVPLEVDLVDCAAVGKFDGGSGSGDWGEENEESAGGQEQATAGGSWVHSESSESRSPSVSI